MVTPSFATLYGFLGPLQFFKKSCIANSAERCIAEDIAMCWDQHAISCKFASNPRTQPPAVMGQNKSDEAGTNHKCPWRHCCSWYQQPTSLAWAAWRLSLGSTGHKAIPSAVTNHKSSSAVQSCRGTRVDTVLQSTVALPQTKLLWLSRSQQKEVLFCRETRVLASFAKTFRCKHKHRTNAELTYDDQASLAVTTTTWHRLDPSQSLHCFTRWGDAAHLQCSDSIKAYHAPQTCIDSSNHFYMFSCNLTFTYSIFSQELGSKNIPTSLQRRQQFADALQQAMFNQRLQRPGELDEPTGRWSLYSFARPAAP